ncbi:MAG: polysaccharide deacetylase family protein [Armatimonadota bacterium]|nr:polysaccharide deacetylase family protein [Armatimonadota bacterium]
MCNRLRVNLFKAVCSRKRIAATVLLCVVAVGFPIKVHEAAEVVTLPVRCLPTSQRIVALTYDDGPHPVYTPKLLRILRHYGVRATFFVIGERAQTWPDIVRQAAREGHVIANHTYTHRTDLESLSPSKITRELSRTQSVIGSLTGHRYDFFRPPKGFVNYNLAMTARANGYRIVLWSVSADHHEAKTPEQMAERVIERVRPGAIILMHDGKFAVRWRDVVATPLIIRALRKMGYRFVTVPELLDRLEANKKQRTR